MPLSAEGVTRADVLAEVTRIIEVAATSGRLTYADCGPGRVVDPGASGEPGRIARRLLENPAAPEWGVVGKVLPALRDVAYIYRCCMS
jgi:hypothetical protein